MASALSMTISLLELVGRMAFGSQIVQAEDGDEPRFQSVAHSVQLCTGLISAGLVIFGAYPMARTFGMSELTWAFASLALVPMARGVIHLDLSRFQRRFRYSPGVLAEVVPQALTTVAAWPLTCWLGDFRAVLGIMLGKELLTVTMSHILADRPYRLSWKRHYVRQMLAFGWPLLLNGLVMFSSQQGDQIIVGSIFSLSDLGTYSIAFNISSIPFFIFSQVGTSLMLPALATHQANPKEFDRYYRLCMELMVLGSLILMGPLIVAGGPIVRLLYGPKYDGVGVLMTVFGTMVALRFFRLAPSVASMSRADTMNQVIGNIARTISLPLAMLLVASGSHNLITLAACGIIGEILAIITVSIRIWRKMRIRLTAHAMPLFFLVGWISLGAWLQHLLGDTPILWVSFAAVLLLWSIGLAASLMLFPLLRVTIYGSVVNLFAPASLVK
jgi:O-antigen/teichoic acid export membrane protein